uniref:Uncharacterized protein n=1 Tax=Oryza barthii TaxID=65489 RepID=A0A0D3H7S8_9ORYZ
MALAIGLVELHLAVPPALLDPLRDAGHIELDLGSGGVHGGGGGGVRAAGLEADWDRELQEQSSKRSGEQSHTQQPTRQFWSGCCHLDGEQTARPTRDPLT